MGDFDTTERLFFARIGAMIEVDFDFLKISNNRGSCNRFGKKADQQDHRRLVSIRSMIFSWISVVRRSMGLILAESVWGTKRMGCIFYFRKG